MRTKIGLALVLGILGILAVSTPADARNTRLHLPLATVLSGPDAQRTLDPGVQLYFGRQPFAEPVTRFNLTTSDKNSNFLNKTDEDGCNWVFLSAVKGLQQAARKMGGNAVVNIVSIYKKEEIVSETHFECNAGTFVGSVVLRGEVVLLK